MKYLLALFLCLVAVPAFGQCNGQFPANSVCGNSGISAAQGKPTPLSSFAGGGGGGLLITRAQIPTTNTGAANQLTLTGYATPNDDGSGAPYTCNQSSVNANSIGAIQDIAGNWCGFDIPRVNNGPGWMPGWFGADHTGGPDAAPIPANSLGVPALQQTIDAAAQKLGKTYCSGTFQSTLPLYFDAPGNMRGGGRWSGQFVFLPSSTGGYQPGSLIATTTAGVPPFYANNDAIGYWGYPGSPDSTGYQMDFAYKIVSSTNSVTYNPSWTTATANGIVIASFKGTAAIGTPNKLLVSGPGISQGTPVATTGSAPAGALITVEVVDLSGNGLTGITDDATGGPNTYTNAVSVDNPTLGGVYIFHSETGHALPAGGHITVNNGGPATYAIIAFSVVNAAGGLDKTASVDNTSSPSTSPSVSTGTLAQTNEVIFGAIVTINARPSIGWVESSGFTSATTSLWSPGGWDVATTYAAGDHVFRNGIPWASLTNGNIGNDPLNDLGINVKLVHWQPTNFSRSDTNDAPTFYGPPRLTSGSEPTGCTIRPTFNNSVMFVMGYHNGATLDSVEFFPNGGSLSGYCGAPATGAAIAILSNGSGAQTTLLRNVGITNVYYGITVGAATIENFNTAGAGLSAETRAENLVINKACVGYYVLNAQSFINNLTNVTIDATTGVWTVPSVGLAVFNGNISHIASGNANKFSISGVSASYDSVGLKLTATLTLAGDPFMLVSCTDDNIAPNDYNRFNNRCSQNIYTAWTVKLTGGILIPFVLKAFNPGTGVATWRALDEWLQGYGGAGGGTPALPAALLTEINGLTSIWAAETSRTFVGAGITADQIHVETLEPYELVDSTWCDPSAPAGCTGAPAGTLLRNIVLNTEFTFAGAYTPGNAVSEAQFFAAQMFGFVKVGNGGNSAGGNITLDNICCNLISGGFGYGETMMLDLIQGNTPADGRLIIKGGAFARFNHRFPANINGNGNMTGQYPGNNSSTNWSASGSAAFAQGDFENTPWRGVGVDAVGTSEQMRALGWNSGPFWGVRPAPWTVPCVSPTQYVTLLGTLPAFSSNTVTYPILWSGQMYRVCDWNMTPGTYNAGSTYSIGDIVTSASVTYISRVNSNMGNTPASSPTQWAPFHYNFVSNHGTGYSFGQSLAFPWTIRNNYPWVQITGGVLSSFPFFAGLDLGFTPTQGGCTTQENFIVRESHFTLQWLAVFLTDTDRSGGLVPQWGNGSCATVSNTTINQAAYSITGLN